jgi:hypothetical protein
VEHLGLECVDKKRISLFVLIIIAYKMNFSQEAYIDLIKTFSTEMDRLVELSDSKMKQEVFVSNLMIFNKFTNLLRVLNRNGWDKVVEDARASPLEPSCPCRKAKGYSKGWCGVTKAGYNTCDQ